MAVKPSVHSVTPGLSLGRDTAARAVAFEVLGSTMTRVSPTRTRATTAGMLSLPSLRFKLSLVA